jgi:hypothetical protein
MVEAVSRLKGHFPKARGFVTITVRDSPVSRTYGWNVAKFRDATNPCCWV